MAVEPGFPKPLSSMAWKLSTTISRGKVSRVSLLLELHRHIFSLPIMSCHTGLPIFSTAPHIAVPASHFNRPCVWRASLELVCHGCSSTALDLEDPGLPHDGPVQSYSMASMVSTFSVQSDHIFVVSFCKVLFPTLCACDQPTHAIKIS